MNENVKKIFTLDDMFNEYDEYVSIVKSNEIDSFPNHPYKVKDDDKMEDLVESIKNMA